MCSLFFIEHLHLSGICQCVDAIRTDIDETCVTMRLDYMFKHRYHSKFISEHNLEVDLHDLLGRKKVFALEFYNLCILNFNFET